MAGGTVLPGSTSRRYQGIVGGDGQQTTLYLVRRRLGFSVDEWQALPWWQQNLYLDGLIKELSRESGKGAPGASSSFVAAGPGASAQLAALGVTVQR